MIKLKSTIKKIISKVIKLGYKLLYKYIPIDDKYILFVSYHGKGYLCNPKYLHKYMISDEKYKHYTFIWAVKKVNDVEISNAKIIKYNGIRYFYYLARSKYWIINCKMPKYILKKDKQIYIQTWHGTPLKRLANDIEIGKDATFYRTKVSKLDMVKSYNEDAKKYNYFISPNSFSTEKFISSFNINRNIIIENGYPRNDFLTNLSDGSIVKLKKKYNIPLNKKVILYAPTWRDNSFNSKGYIFQLRIDFKLWKKELGEEYVVIFKPHYLIVNKYYDKGLEDFLYVMDENRDINELYAISDMLITDYSSVFFDYAILRRPIYFYMYDLEEYAENLRGFYLNINKDLPGDIIKDEMQLLNLIRNNEVYKLKNTKKIESFNLIYNSLQDGQCSKKIIEKIIN